VSLTPDKARLHQFGLRVENAESATISRLKRRFLATGTEKQFSLAKPALSQLSYSPQRQVTNH
jgi:hypothetical protein